MAIPANASGGSTHDRKRQRPAGVSVAVTHATAVNNKGMIQQGTVAIRRRSQALDETCEQTDVVDVYFRVLENRFLAVAVMRNRVVRLTDAERGISSLAH